MKMPTPPSRRFARHRPLALIVAALLAVFCAVPAGAVGKSSARPLYWGALIGPQLTGTPPPWDMGAITAFERITHKGPSLIQFSAPFANCYASPCTYYGFPTGAMQDIRDHGSIPFFNWASQSIPSSLEEPEFRLASIIDGSLDEYISDFAIAAREWGHPFFLRFNWEMNGFWFPWNEGVNGNQPGEFVAAWRHVHDIFTAVGATNATWVWCPNVDFTRKLVPMRSLYPGGRYVDWTCVDGFNWGETSKSAGWMSFNQIFRGTYHRILKFARKKPMVIGETASEERGGSKAEWIHNMLNIIPTHFKKIRAVIWFDQRDQGMNWPIESSKKSERSFAHSIGRSVYRPNIYQHLRDGPVRPPAWGKPPSEPPPPAERLGTE